MQSAPGFGSRAWRGEFLLRKVLAERRGRNDQRSPEHAPAQVIRSADSRKRHPAFKRDPRCTLLSRTRALAQSDDRHPRRPVRRLSRSVGKARGLERARQARGSPGVRRIVEGRIFDEVLLALRQPSQAEIVDKAGEATKNMLLLLNDG